MNNMDTSYNVYDYPQAPEYDEAERDITIYVTLRVSDLYPETWDDGEIKDYIKNNIKDYISDADIEINEIEV